MRMNTGPHSIFDNIDFIYIFEKCVHFISSITLIEEQCKDENVDFDNTELMVLKELCSACLESLDHLSALAIEKEPEKLRMLLMELTRHENDFKLIQQMSFASLDAEMKLQVLPEVSNRLALLNSTLAQYCKQNMGTASILHTFYHTIQSIKSERLLGKMQYMFGAQTPLRNTEEIELNSLTTKAIEPHRK